MENGIGVSRNQDKRNSRPKLKAQNTDVLVWDSEWSDFLRTDRVWVGLEI
jgi:hypothetical protein